MNAVLEYGISNFSFPRESHDWPRTQRTVKILCFILFMKEDQLLEQSQQLLPQGRHQFQKKESRFQF